MGDMLKERREKSRKRKLLLAQTVGSILFIPAKVLPRKSYFFAYYCFNFS